MPSPEPDTASADTTSFDSGPDTVNVVLTGFMGTGKSSAGRRLAQLLDLEFVDTDAVIEERHGPIPEIFRTQGEQAFRDLEQRLARELADSRGRVISTGGRMMLDPANVQTLGESSLIFCLVASPEVIVERLAAAGPETERPLLAVEDPRQRIIELLAERREGYAQFPQVPTDDLTSDEVAADLARRVRQHRPRSRD